MEEFVFTSASKTALIDSLSLRLGRNQVRFPPHPALVGEMRNFVATPGEHGGETLSARSGGHDDCVCAFALAVHAAAPFLARSDRRHQTGNEQSAAMVARGGLREHARNDYNDNEGSTGTAEREFTWSSIGVPFSPERREKRRGKLPRWVCRLLLPVLTRAYHFAPGRRVGVFLRGLWGEVAEALAGKPGSG